MSEAQVRNYGRLKELLESQETFPSVYTFKVIGNNTPGFARGVRRFEEQFPKIQLKGRKQSAEAAHLSLTYSLVADSAAEVIWLYEQAAAIEDVRILL